MCRLTDAEGNYVQHVDWEIAVDSAFLVTDWVRATEGSTSKKKTGGQLHQQLHEFGALQFDKLYKANYEEQKANYEEQKVIEGITMQDGDTAAPAAEEIELTMLTHPGQQSAGGTAIPLPGKSEESSQCLVCGEYLYGRRCSAISFGNDEKLKVHRGCAMTAGAVGKKTPPCTPVKIDPARAPVEVKTLIKVGGLVSRLPQATALNPPPTCASCR